ncbi:MAG: hypothetical protein KDA43_14785 [Hyphomonas sp.]|nr:hypothetical protein [Hyphomonas sp.]
MMDDKVFAETVVDTMLSQGTKDMALRCLALVKRPTPGEIRAAARLFGADWRAVCVLAGWAQTPEGDWLDIHGEDFDWNKVRPEVLAPRAVGPGSEMWNQELAAFALRRTLAGK